MTQTLNKIKKSNFLKQISVKIIKLILNSFISETNTEIVLHCDLVNNFSLLLCHIENTILLEFYSCVSYCAYSEYTKCYFSHGWKTQNMTFASDILYISSVEMETAVEVDGSTCFYENFSYLYFLFVCSKESESFLEVYAFVDFNFFLFCGYWICLSDFSLLLLSLYFLVILLLFSINSDIQ